MELLKQNSDITMITKLRYFLMSIRNKTLTQRIDRMQFLVLKIKVTKIRY
jgi:hypothetical protein